MEKNRYSKLFESELASQDWTGLALWQKVEAALPQKKNMFAIPLRFAAVTASILLILAGFLALTPIGRAFAQEVVHFFNPVEPYQFSKPVTRAELVNTDEQMIAKPLPAESEGLAECEHVWCAQPLSLEEAQTLASYELAVLDPQPEGFTLEGAQLLSDKVYIYYSSDRGDLVLVQSVRGMGSNQLKEVGKNAIIESLTVGGSPAEFVQGTWTNPVIGSTDEWDSENESKSLRWQNDTLNLELIAVPSKAQGAKFEISKADMLEAAGNMASKSAVVLLPELKIQSLEDAENEAGFEGSLLPLLPEAYRFEHAAYDSDTQTLCQYYSYGPKAYPSLYLAQSPSAWDDTQIITKKAEFSGSIYDQEVKTETLLLNGEHQADYISQGVRQDAVCSVGGYKPHQAILFEADGMHYGIFAWGRMDEFSNVIVTRTELIQMAASVLEIDSAEKLADPEKFRSLKDAEQQFGSEIQFPRQMLSDYAFTELDLGSSIFGNQGGKVTRSSILFLGPDSGLPWIDYIRVSQEQNFPIGNGEGLEYFRNQGYDTELKVWGLPALYNEQVQLIANSNSLEQCMNRLYWLDGDTLYAIEANTGTRISQETILQIAESMKP